jgi:hypothetical protein
MNDRINDHTELGKSVESSCAEEQTSDSKKMSRRNALAVLGKHTAYTAPAVLLVLALGSKRATAWSH